MAIAAVGLTTGFAPPTYRSVTLKDIPHVRQLPDFCGEACAVMALRRLGHRYSQEQVFAATRVDPALGRGAYTPELARALKRIGFDVGPVWFQVEAGKAAPQLEAQWRALHQDLRRGVASIVCMHYDDSPDTTEHFRLISGYDADSDEVVYHEPAEDGGAYRRMDRSRFLRLWPLKYRAETWTVVRMALRADALKPAKAQAGFSAADYAQHVLALRKKLPPGFSVVIEPPFVVIGDEPENVVKSRAEKTVRWATQKLKRAYFDKDPQRILDIWLFQDKASYDKHTRSIFGDRPSTPFGYYSEDHGALIMNIETGGGTLVHEIVHPFMDANFPAVPAWFNEGLGSLYEQSGERDGGIRGLTNWRLGGLQEAIQAGRLPSFERLTTMGDDAFYGDDSGDHYAMARYLCYYLQEQDLLVEFYRRFRRDRTKDPEGYRTLQGVLGEQDMAAFQKRWERYVMGLRFPPST